MVESNDQIEPLEHIAEKFADRIADTLFDTHTDQPAEEDDNSPEMKEAVYQEEVDGENQEYFEQESPLVVEEDAQDQMQINDDDN